MGDFPGHRTGPGTKGAERCEAPPNREPRTPSSGFNDYMTHALLYHSIATAPLSDLELRALGVRSSQRNARHRITGLLLHGQHAHVPGATGAFVQWIEGPRADVRSLFESIADDPRHTDIETLAEGSLRELTGRDDRLFPGWNMETEAISELPATLEGFLQYVRDRREEGAGRWKRAA